ncbi:hypothetical protein FOL47_009470 [Perkinsus chesapeaki]|uniref:Uncharacterized protein n=1 Tax=Perkinsus chesapeaki TaxID=330153 RepID=A0A7J6L865_PERCH|nr:hypothetical protein FOL47_009470 [Perkinsus chesapeaki]
MMIYPTIGTFALVCGCVVISLAQPITNYLVDSPNNCSQQDGMFHNGNCFFVKGDAEVLLGGYHLGYPFPDSLLGSLDFACGVGPPDNATGFPTVRVEGQGRTFFKQIMAKKGVEVSINFILPTIKNDGEYATASGRQIDFGMDAYVGVRPNHRLVGVTHSGWLTLLLMEYAVFATKRTMFLFTAQSKLTVTLVLMKAVLTHR